MPTAGRPADLEFTRLATGRDPGLARDILTAANDWLAAQDARECLFLGPPSFIRMAKSMGYNPDPLGPVAGNAEGRFLAFSCAVIERAIAPATKAPETRLVA